MRNASENRTCGLCLFEGQFGKFHSVDSSQEEIEMTKVLLNRRGLLAGAGAVVALGTAGLRVPARAAGLAPTPSMRGGSNNYLPGAPIVDRIGGGGFWMTGTVRRAGDG